MPQAQKLQASRYPSRTNQDKDLIYQVLEESLFCTVSYHLEGQTYAIPTGFCLHENQLIVHGSIKSAFLEKTQKAGEVCISTFLFDALVLANTAFNHSVNYRSVVIFAKAEEITKEKEKKEVLKVFTDKYVPNRWETLTPITENEMKATKVLGFSLEQASIKMRSGLPNLKDEATEKEIWTGLIPSKLTWETPIVDDRVTQPQTPQHIQDLYLK